MRGENIGAEKNCLVDKQLHTYVQWNPSNMAYGWEVEVGCLPVWAVAPAMPPHVSFHVTCRSLSTSSWSLLSSFSKTWDITKPIGQGRNLHFNIQHMYTNTYTKFEHSWVDHFSLMCTILLGTEDIRIFLSKECTRWREGQLLRWQLEHSVKTSASYFLS